MRWRRRLGARCSPAATSLGAEQPQVRESGGSGQDQLPRRQFLELRTAQRRGLHPASDAFPFRPRSHPRAGEPGLLRTVTPEACGRRRPSLQRICGQTSVPAPSCGNRSLPLASWLKPVTSHLPPVETGHSQFKMGQIPVGSDRFRHVEEWRARWQTVRRQIPASRRPRSVRQSQSN
jgi:hypothetical protein